MSEKTDKLKAALEARGFRQVRVWYGGVSDGYMFTHVDDACDAEYPEAPEDPLGHTFEEALAWINGIPDDAEQFPGWPGLTPKHL